MESLPAHYHLSQIGNLNLGGDCEHGLLGVRDPMPLFCASCVYGNQKSFDLVDGPVWLIIQSNSGSVVVMMLVLWSPTIILAQ